MALNFFRRDYLVSMPTVLELSTWMAVGPCFCPIYDRVVRIGTAFWVFTKMVPYLASAADAMILRMILHTTSKMPLVVGTKSSGFLGSGGPLVHWLGFWIDQLKGRRRLNGCPIASHFPCIVFLLVHLRRGSLRA